MYSDRDGTATKQSQSAYDSRVRYIRLATSVLVSIGFGAAIADGEYGRAIIQWPADPVWALHWDRLLWPILWLHTISLYMQQDAISTHHSALRGALMSSVLIVFRLLGNSPDRETSEVALLVPLQLFCAILCVLVQLSIPRRPQLFTNQGHAVDAESSSSVLVRYSMFWCHAALDIASKSDTLSTMPALNYETRASSQSVITVPSSRPYVWNRILVERFSTFVKQYIVVAMRAAFAFAPPYCLERLLQCLESSETVSSRAWMWFAGMGASAIVETVASNHTAWAQMSEIGMPVKAQLIDSIFRKQLRKKDCREEKPVSKRESQLPDVINVVSADSDALSFYAAIAYILPFRLFKFLLAVLFLYWLLGWQSTLAAVVATLACFSAHRSTVKQTNAARKTLRSSRDRTTAILKEAFVSLREIKFSSLESQWESHIDAVREQELRDLSWSRTAVTIRGIWDTAGPFLVVIAALCAYMYTGGDITPSIVFPMINVLYQLQDTLSFVPTALNDYFHSIDTSGRIDTYLASAEQPLLVEPSPSGNIIFEDVTISWPSDHINEVGDDARFSLQNLNMEFPFGELSIVSGKTGSGKSLLLTGILDEAELVQGHIKAPSAQSCPNSVAYVAQVPWLHSGTIQENILLGSPLERERYNRVIAACALVPDFHALADGDQTQIGRRGIKLSGGQRTRVAFARALYSSAKTLILDDIFSTLDTQVSKEIICALTGEICKGRTRVLVTHHVSLCLPFAKYLVHLENNKVVYSGAPESAPKNILHMEAEDAKGIRTSGPASASSTLSHTGAATKFGTGDAIERKTASKSEWNYYRSYFIAAGGIQFGATFALLLVVSRLLNALTSYLLGRLKSHGPSRTASSELSTPQEDPTLFYSISLYIGAVALVIITTSLSKLHTDASTLRAARVLFRQMTFTVLRMPLIWLDATPVGAMLKAFTVDVRSVDELVLATLASFIDSAINVLTAICIGIATILLVAWCSKLVSRYKKASAMVRRTDGGPMADILEHVTSTSAGIATIRSFGASNTYIEAMQRYLDAESTAKRHFYIFSRWLTLQMSLLGIVFAMITGILLLTSESTNKVARVGFSLTFVMSLSNMISTTFSKFGYLELYMSSISSVMQYTEHDIEDPSGNDVAADWPSAGEIDVDDLQVGYSASLPPALKSVSFHVKRGEKVGIVGRTGAGKSSLTLSLLRLLNVQKGSISIDSIDISTIKVGDLRSRIGFIPQAPTLFCGTIRSNLDYFVQLSNGEINDALRHVGLLAEEGGADSGRFTAESPVAAGGENMSLGQRQLLCLAQCGKSKEGGKYHDRSAYKLEAREN
ncbi:hypothetical protein MY5147_009871, partial [Beauveria neobassiana]